MNLPGLLMGVAAGIGITAALTHGLVGFARRPRDRARIAFAAASLAAAVAALALAVLYATPSMDTHIAVMKWAFYPATVCWTLATIWFVAFAADVRPRWFLRLLTAGLLFVIVVDLVLPRGTLHDTSGTLQPVRILGGSVLVMSGSSPHLLHYVTDALTVIGFLFMCYAAHRVYRSRAADKASYLGSMTALLAAATLLDTINEHSVITSFTTLYLTQACFAVVILTVSLVLRREALQTEAALRMYQTEMDALVRARVVELDEANASLAREAAERNATAEALRRRVDELGALQRMAGILAMRTDLGEAMDEATGALIALFEARYARVRLLDDAEDLYDPLAAARTRREVPRWVGDREGAQPHGALDLASSDAALAGGSLVSGDAATWPGTTERLRMEAVAQGIGAVLAVPLTATSGTVGALVIARDATRGPFTDEQLRLARTVGEALAAVIEIDRLHRRETRQAAAEERQALARDLHDAVTQSIYSATLIAEALPAVYERDADEGLRNLERLRRLVRAALAEMRTLLFELRPAELRTAPLDVLIERLSDALAGQTYISVDVRVDEGLDLPPDVKVVFYRVTQEAFSNIVKHARASAVSARIEAADHGVTLTVVDDGRGFDPAAPREGHMGLHIMAERLAGVGAELSVRSAPGEGTTLTAIWRRAASEDGRVERMQA
jgi:signal transduction histidine kinase